MRAVAGRLVIVPRVSETAGGHEGAIGHHHVGGDVDGEAEAAEQAADAAAECQPCHAGGGDPVGGLLGVEEFPATVAGYARPLGWLSGFGTVCLAGIEGTGSYGAGLARHVTAAGIRVVEVDRSDRQDRRRQGKSDPLDAVSAARAAQSGRARGAPKGRDGAVEAIRALMVARRSAAGERTRTINQARVLLLTGPDDLRARFTRHTPAALVTRLASLRPRPGDVAGHAVRVALRELGRRARFLDGQLERLDELIVPLVSARAPGLLALYGAGPRTAALLLIAAGDHPGRLRSEAPWAHLCGVAPGFLWKDGWRATSQLVCRELPPV
jgi:transposase